MNDLPSDQKTQHFWKLWALETEHGRQVWKFTPDSSNIDMNAMSRAFAVDPAANSNSGDKVYRSSCTATQLPKPETPQSSLEDAVEHGIKRAGTMYASLQAEEGHWPGDYGGPMFLLPGLIIVSHVTETPFPAAHRTLMRRYMLNHQNDDGGWGLHIEGDSTMFGSVMQYVALRLLGHDADTPELQKAQQWIQKHGGATAIPPWGKFYLSVLGVYEWQGCDSLLPELWLLPKWASMHPSRYWCHARMVYLPMSYCYGHRLTGAVTPIIEALRSELYTQTYESINWTNARASLAQSDLHSTPSTVLKILNRYLINPYERIHNGRWRKKALRFSLEYVDAEDAQTDFVDIGPVNQIINSLCVWHAYGKDSHQFKRHVNRWYDYLWVAEDGMKMNGYNGSQLWDTAFAVQAMTEAGLHEHIPDTIRKAYSYLDITQVKDDVEQRERFFRHKSKGGWPFSTADHGWPISDCTAEGLSATLAIHDSGILNADEKSITPQRMQNAVDLLLSFQNIDGGWATYENTRGPKWLEYLNPSGVFRDIMIDYSYTECTSACIRALNEYHNEDQGYRSEEIARATQRGIEFIKSKQLKDDSWIGSWAVCFTYGTWFGVEGLLAGGVPETDPVIQKACEFLISKQNPDGGWGESFQSCVERRYIGCESQVVNTSWALLTLLAAGNSHPEAIEAGIRFLLANQQADGDWPQQRISGVFNANCMITYTAYRNVFPIWALGRYRKLRN